MLEVIQNGPVVTWIDVTQTFLTYAGGPESVWFNEDECVSYEDEEVPPECTRDSGYTCLPREKCTTKIPKHCDRYKKSVLLCPSPTHAIFRRFLSPPCEPLPAGHVITIVGYGTTR